MSSSVELTDHQSKNPFGDQYVIQSTPVEPPESRGPFEEEITPKPPVNPKLLMFLRVMSALSLTFALTTLIIVAVKESPVSLSTSCIRPSDVLLRVAVRYATTLAMPAGSLIWFFIERGIFAIIDERALHTITRTCDYILTSIQRFCNPVIQFLRPVARRIPPYFRYPILVVQSIMGLVQTGIIAHRDEMVISAIRMSSVSTTPLITPYLNLIIPCFNLIIPYFNLITPYFNLIIPYFNPIIPYLNQIIAYFF
ncbi:hypothetical protein DFJ63DRAFT_336796 [Scheffersomyces coipomensis]|uniref:uncharacterized protein n=1 Tax=Scheffersomyces coipomensis TaxID=1788519 RepID=UPI00315C5B17